MVLLAILLIYKSIHFEVIVWFCRAATFSVAYLYLRMSAIQNNEPCNHKQCKRVLNASFLACFHIAQLKSKEVLGQSYAPLKVKSVCVCVQILKRGKSKEV